jgi:asparagine synthase (glutamine-hydrolysing)
VPTAERLAREVDALVWTQDEPFGSTSIFAQWCVMALAREQGVTVLLDGQGADEALAGYQPFDVHVGDLMRRGHLGRAVHEVRAAHAVAGRSPAATLTAAALWWLPTAARAAAARVRGREGLGVLAPEARARHDAHAPRYQSRSSLAGYLYDQVEFGLPELLRYEDRNSMAFHIEARVPFVDYRVMEYAFRFADGLRIRDGWTKYLLRAAMRDALPESIAWRRDKVGFETPERAWMQALLRDRLLPGEELRSAAFVQPERFRALVEAARTDGVTSRLLWRLINLELWLRAWSPEGRPAVRPAPAGVAYAA